MNHRFLEPIKVGNQTLKNRVIYMAMAKSLSGFDAKVTARELAYVTSVAKGGVGLFVTGAMVVDDEWPSTTPMQPGLYNDVFLPGLTLMAKAAHDNGTKILFQLWHGGEVDYSGSNPPTINDISVDEIHRIQRKFIAAAKRAMLAGADGVEFQTCHTYIANQFLSPLWNHRTDEYGWDTLENRTRFVVECLTALREVIGPDKILSVKMQGFDYPKGEGPNGNDGITPEMAAEVAPILVKAGADMLTVTAGGTLTGKDDIMTGDVHRAEGWKVHAARAVKAVVSVPVAASGNIRHPEFVDQIMANGDCDMVGMARGLYAEREWVKKCAEGRESELRFCLSCMHCWNVDIFTPDMSGCSVNPFASREGSQRQMVKNGAGRVVAIVGAGPAGMEAAVTLKQRGFEPVVFEKENRIGGNINIAKKPPFKGKFQWAIDYYESMVKTLGIDVRLGTEATVENVMALKPYSVLVASGSSVTTLPVEGLDGENVLQSRDILDKDMVFSGKKMAVIGGGITGMETALYLRAQGNEVSVVDFAPKFPSVQGPDPRFMMEAKLETEHCEEQGIALLYEHKVLKYADGKLSIEGVKDGIVSDVAADIVVLSAGVKANNPLLGALMAAGQQSVWQVGDANFPAKIYKAVVNASKFAYGLN
ncbi:MAG: NAD(P)/FAD-dependent oxidoreductase [Oscillospiraceae bacterium]